MATPTTLNITPINPPNKELEAMPLADKDTSFKIWLGTKITCRPSAN